MQGPGRRNNGLREGFNAAQSQNQQFVNGRIIASRFKAIRKTVAAGAVAKGVKTFRRMEVRYI